MSNLQSGADKAQMIELLNSIKIPILGAGGGFAPIGTVNAYMGITAPQGWLICNGQTVNITDYPELATHFASHFGSANFFGGDGTTTFAVPDLRGEFLRGSGTNSHTNQGSGANVGVHQDGTETAWENYAKSGSLYVGGTSDLIGEPKNYDSQIGSSSGRTIFNKSSTDAANVPIKYTTRPTNTSVTYIIKATVSGDANAHHYSTEEQVVGKWIDGKTVYEKTIQTTFPSSATTKFVDTGVSIDNIIDYDAISISSSGYLKIASFAGTDNMDVSVKIQVFSNDAPANQNKIVIVLKNSSWVNRSVNITLRYTKTS